MTDVELLRARILASGLSARRFAREILTRDERTVRRWLAGKSPIPKAVIQFLEKPPKRTKSGPASPNTPAISG